MTNFGWSYPPGCSGPPEDFACDDGELCVTCGKELPDEVEPGTPQDSGFCDERCRDREKDIIRNIKDLAQHHGVFEDGQTDDRSAARVAQRLFKYTDCGVGFCYKPPMGESYGYAVVVGYCEGVDAECPSHAWTFPFWPEEWDAAVGEADNEGCDLWNETHGCPECDPEHPAGARAINPKCETCGGGGEII